MGELESAGLPKLKMNEWPNAVQTIIYRQLPPKSGGENGGDGINEVVNTPSEAVNEVVNTPSEVSEGINTPSKNSRETINETINETIKSIPGINKPRLMKRLGKSHAAITRAIAELVAAGEIEHRGSKKTGGYYLTEGENKTAAGGAKGACDMTVYEQRIKCRGRDKKGE